MTSDRGSISLPCLAVAIVAMMISMIVGHWILNGPRISATTKIERCIP